MPVEAWKNGKKTGFPGQGLVTESWIALDATRYACQTYNLEFRNVLKCTIPERMNETKIFHFVKNRDVQK